MSAVSSCVRSGRIAAGAGPGGGSREAGRSCCALGTLPLPPGVAGLSPGVPAHAVLRGGKLLLAPGGGGVPVRAAGPVRLLRAARLQAVPEHWLG